METVGKYGQQSQIDPNQTISLSNLSTSNSKPVTRFDFGGIPLYPQNLFVFSGKRPCAHFPPIPKLTQNRRSPLAERMTQIGSQICDGLKNRKCILLKLSYKKSEGVSNGFFFNSKDIRTWFLNFLSHRFHLVLLTSLKNNFHFKP